MAIRNLITTSTPSLGSALPGVGSIPSIGGLLPGSSLPTDIYTMGSGTGIAGTGPLEPSASKPQYILKIQQEATGEDSTGEDGGAESDGESASLVDEGGGLPSPGDGVPAPAVSSDIAFQSMLEMSANESSNLPSEPIEQGSFANYNRTIEPITMTCRLALQGEPSEIQDTITRLQELKKGTDKLTFIMPMASYENMMLESFDYRRDDHTGHNVLIVDVRLKEVREIETQKTTSSVTEPEPEPVSEGDAADGSCCSEVDCGEVQGYEPSGYESESAEDESGGRRSSILFDTIGKI